ncbi:nucleotidyltransferase domain-containing protein [Rhizobium ruizarguesonis]|uniref:nucleotidyltransferase domain-containing protein n=1 Tax=Rhizobium ruizarguesonis TaxID=2081791 RepID=UPI0013EEF4BE|nr:nucleotidyltransferase [Rhizobium ruizarguesonis]
MGILINLDMAAAIDPLDGILIDIARSSQVPKTKHEEAVEHYLGLCQHVDRKGSPLEGKILECYPSGSFSIHAATYTYVRSMQHDVDFVLEVNYPITTDPQWLLDVLHKSIKGERGSRYYDFKIERKSRCVTVFYPDGVTVDLMPIARIPGGPERSGVLFHHNADVGEKYTKEVNPKAFTNHFNANIGSSDVFASRYRTRRLMADGHLQERAETQPMPDHVPIEEKSPRLVAIQLTKRFRDVQFRKRQGRRPPSVVIAAIALDAGPMSDSLCDEVIAIANIIQRRIRVEDANYRLLEVRNPAHHADVFTDRWPENQFAQRLWRDDLSRLVKHLTTLRAGDFDAQQLMKILRELFGETLAERAVQDHYRAYANFDRNNLLGIGKTGAVKSALAAPAALGLSVPARANTNMGGSIEDTID